MPWLPASRAKRRDPDRMTLHDVLKELQIVRVHSAAVASTVATASTEQAHQRYAIERNNESIAALRGEVAELRKSLGLVCDQILTELREV